VTREELAIGAALGHSVYGPKKGWTPDPKTASIGQGAGTHGGTWAQG